MARQNIAVFRFDEIEQIVDSSCKQKIDRGVANSQRWDGDGSLPNDFQHLYT